MPESHGSSRSGTTLPLWVPEGTPTTVAGVEIPGGMIYVGTGLECVGRAGSVEPALIDPELQVDLLRPDRKCVKMPLHESYSAIPPETRAAYLQWLAGGRRDPGVGIGLVFLFFCGLERRVLFDARSDPRVYAEIPNVVAEVDRLLGVYGGSRGSFGNHASALAEVLRGLDAGNLVDFGPLPSGLSTGSEFPLSVRLSLGTLSRQGKPIPADLALTWYLSSPATRPNTTIQSCAEEFTAAFRRRYRERFGDGLAVDPPKKTVDLLYEPVNVSFGGTLRLEFSSRRLKVAVPDVTSMAAPLARIEEVVESSVADLARLSRLLARYPTLRSSPIANALLPAELATGSAAKARADLWNAVDQLIKGQTLAEIPGRELLTLWREPGDVNLGRADLELLAQGLENGGIGFEPDMRFGGHPLLPDRPCVIFRLPHGSPISPSPVYAAAVEVLHGAVAAASAADPMERRETVKQLNARLEGTCRLTEPELARLRAHLRWLLSEGPFTASSKRRPKALEKSQRGEIARFLEEFAGADGRVTPAELEMFGTLFRHLWLDTQGPRRLELACPPPGRPARPVKVRSRAASSSGFVIPPRPGKNAAPTLVLDMRRVEEKVAQTAAVTKLLRPIFTEEDEPGAGARPPVPSSGCVAGLDGPHSKVLRALAVRQSWSRAEIEKIAAKSGVMPYGALDTLNELALEVCGDPLWDGDDTVTFDATVLKELLDVRT